MSVSIDPPQRYALAEDSDATVDALRGVVRFLHLLRRRQKFVGGCFLVGIAVGLAYFALAPREYESVAKLMIIQQSPDHVSTVSEQSSSEEVMASQRELVSSEKVVRAAIDELEPEHRVDLVDVSPAKWTETIGSRLSTSSVRRTNHMQIRYRSRDRETSAAVVGAVLQAYLQFVEVSHRSGAADVLEALTGERDQLNAELYDKQQELQAFRQRIGHLAVSKTDGVVEPIIGRALQLNKALVEAQQQRLELQASQATVDAAIANGEDLRRHLSLVEEVVGQQMLLSALGLSAQDSELVAKQQQSLLEAESELRRLAPYLGPRHPRAVALSEQIQATRQYLTAYHSNMGSRFDSMASEELAPLLRGMLTQSVAQAAGRERQLLASFEAARADAVRQSGDLAQLQMLEREVDRIEKQHDVLFEKIATVDIHQVQAPIRVVPVQDPLPPENPASPKLHLALCGSAFLFLMLGVLSVYLQDLLDDRFGSPEEIADQLGAPVLSMIRQLTPTGGVGLGAVHMVAGGDDVQLEAFRTLRTALALNGEATDRLVISSAEPSDGKTTVSANLAASFAQVGKRTLVIDADLRKPGMTALMEMKGQSGLTDLLVAEGDVGELAEQIAHQTDLKGLDVIPAGPRRPNPAELLASKNFEDLLAWADGKYDQVLVDCPPVLAVSDAQIVGRLVDGVVVVVSPEKNHRRLVVRACESFVAAGVHLFGVVANRISEQTSGGYGYGYGYGYSYGEAEPEEESPAPEASPYKNANPGILAGNWAELESEAQSKSAPTDDRRVA